MRGLLILLVTMFSVAAIAQNIPPASETTAYRQVLVYAGPGATHRELSVLNPGIPARIIERNRTGMWLHIQRFANSEVVQDGWVIAGYLNRSDALRYSQIALNADVPDAVPENVSSRTAARLYEMPILPRIGDAMINVFEHGLALGNRPDVITKVGDSLSVSDQYLTLFSADNPILGPYDYLEPALRFFGKSAAEESVAAQIGLTTYVVFDPFWATDARCDADESPLYCEYRIKKPSVAFVLFGPNDIRHMTSEEFDQQMRLITEASLELGVIPVLSTFSVHPDDELYWQALDFNLVVKTIAEEYQIPAVNLWAAAQLLPDFGLDEDHVHMTATGFDFLKLDSGLEMRSGIALQNLLNLHVLNEIYHKLQLDN